IIRALARQVSRTGSATTPNRSLQQPAGAGRLFPDSSLTRPARLQHAPRPPQGVAADGIEHRVHSLDALLEPLGAIVDHVVVFEVSNEVDLRRRDGRADAGAPPVRELNGKAADAAGCPVDEYVLPLLDSGAPKEALPCSEGGNGCDRRGHVIDRCRLASDVL